MLETRGKVRPRTLVVLGITLAVCFAGGVAATDLEVTPLEDFEPSGEPGGPFTPSSKDYQLRNVGPNSIWWCVAATRDWLHLDGEWGSLEPNESTIVTVSLTPAANSLPEGIHTDTLTFGDLTNEEVQTQGVTLTAALPGSIWVSPNSFDVNIIEGCSSTEPLAIGNTRPVDLSFLIRTHVVADSEETVTEVDNVTASGMEGVFSVPEERDFAVPGNTRYKPGELIVRFAAKANGQQQSSEEKSQILSSLGGCSIKRNFKIVPGLSVVKLPPGITVEKALRTFNKAKGILFAEPNYEVKVSSTFPNDARFDELWGMHNTGQSDGTEDADIDAPEAWDITTGSSEIIVGVLDTGVDYTHPDLAANMWVNEAEFYGAPGYDDDDNGRVDDIHGYDFRNHDGNPMDDHGHGTHCAGTIGAVGNNGIGVAGVCWNVRIMALKFLGSDGYGWYGDAIASIEYGTAMGAKVLSNSWGGTDYSGGLRRAIEAAGAAGVLCVAAAGNDNDNTDDRPHYPSSFNSETVISVMATDKNDNKTSGSNYGPVSVDLGAPGKDILSCKPGGGYRYKSGTSMATPHVTGACALLWWMNPALSTTEVKDILLRTVDPTLPGLCVSEGRLNLFNAVSEVRAPWIEIAPEEGTVGSGDSNDVSVTFSAVGMLPGTYKAEIIVASTDPWNPRKVVPVTMAVNADDLQITPAEGLESSGTKGGPFEPECVSYILTNNGSEPVDWTTMETQDWLEVEPNGGVLNASESTEVQVCISPNASLLEPNIYGEVLIFRNTDSNSIKLREVTLKVKPPDYFTESLEADDNDLDFLSVTFRPNGSVGYYEGCRQKVSGFPTEPNGGTYVSLGDDDFAEVVLRGGHPKKKILFYGHSYNRFYIGSNGYITFGQGDSEFAGSLTNHFSMPRISAFFTDLTPPDVQSVSFKQLGDRVAVTFEEVPLYGDKTATNSFQIEMFFVDGTIRITWLDIAPADLVAGLSEGKDFPLVLFEENDLSECAACWPFGDFNKDYLVNLKDFVVLAAHWLDTDCGIPYWCGKTDLDRSGTTEGGDLGIFSENWLRKEDWWLQPLSHWKFDEGEGGVAYDSAGNNHGTLINGPTWTTGQIDGALSFDGENDYVDIKDGSLIGTQSSGTISLWVSSSLSSLSGSQGIYDESAGGTDFRIHRLDNQIEFSRYREQIWAGVSSSPLTWGPTTWYHVAAVWTSMYMKLYVNGDLVDSNRQKGATDAAILHSWFGRFTQSGAGYYFNGTVDDARIYETALTAEEIQQLYHDGLN